ncbi:VQ motif-containing protein 1 [Sesamum angolense]|uniref:VQ motif-containing protein 1 n=1 Tax=Sesamum angolense TaxID=2727404 RepID=A0AAE1WRE9_9LAMI|nr:VQ motif-containing protein 1 [Sesamum angolense]
MGGGNANPVKVVIINTEYVETDAVSFKSVVQRLTGKNSTAAQVPSRNEAPAPRHNAAVLGRGLSFRDFERMLKELPPLDELYRLYPE